MSDQGQSPKKSSDPSISTTHSDPERCLTACDRHGDPGLEKEMDRMYPGTSAGAPGYPPGDDGRELITADPSPPGTPQVPLMSHQEFLATHPQYRQAWEDARASHPNPVDDGRPIDLHPIMGPPEHAMSEIWEGEPSQPNEPPAPKR
ncbi:MAG: hypothetical protein ABSH56_07830 [Bryobacteraceae bacterium]